MAARVMVVLQGRKRAGGEYGGTWRTVCSCWRWRSAMYYRYKYDRWRLRLAWIDGSTIVTRTWP